MHYTQEDPEWAGQRWLIPHVDKAQFKLAKAFQACLRGQAGPGAVHRALGCLERRMERLAQVHPSQDKRCHGGLYHSGCHLTSLANLLAHFGVTVRGHAPTPPRVLRRLQDLGLLTLTGFCARPHINLPGLLTNGQVRLCGYEDHGRAGVPPNRSRLLRELGRDRAAIVNVCGHELYGEGLRHHFLLVLRRKGNDWLACDTNDPEPVSFREHYSRVFQVFSYRKTSGLMSA